MTDQEFNPLAKAFGCAIPKAGADDLMKKLAYNADELTEVEKTYGQFIADIEANEANTKIKSSEMLAENRRLLYDNMVRIGETSKAGVLRPDMGRGLEAWAAARLGVVRKQFGIGQAYTDAGWARFSMQKANRDGAGFMNKALREARLYEQITENSKKLNRIFRDSGIKTKAQQGYIATKAAEYGAVPYLESVGGIGRVTQMEINAKALAFRNYLLDAGIPEAKVNEIFELGADTHRVYNQTAIIARQAGINVADATQQGIGYVPRIFSLEAQKRINWRHKNLAEGTIEWADGSSGDVGSLLTNSRKTFNAAVENEVLLDYVIRNQSSKAYDNPLAIYEKIAGDGANLGDVLDNHRYLGELLSTELGSDTIAALIDNGILGRVPMDSVEVFNHVVEKFNMPFEGINELMSTNWDKGYETYIKQLEGLAAESNYLSSIVSNAVTGKWGVSADAVKADPSRFKGFVPLIGNAERPGALSPSQLDKFFLDKTTRNGVKTGRMVENTYVHPTVAMLIQSIQQASVDPVFLGTLGNILKTNGRIWRGLALATKEFVPRQFFATGIMTLAGGGNLLTLPEITTRTTSYAIAVLSQQMSQADAAAKFFDNTRKIYTSENLTMLEVWHRAKEAGFITDIAPQLGMSQSGVHAATGGIPLFNMRRSLRYAQNVLNEQGIGTLIKEAGGVLDRTVQNMLIPIMWGNNLADTVGRLNGLLSTTRRYTAKDAFHNPINTVTTVASKAGAFVSGVQKYHSTVDAAIAHWGDYFYLYDDVTATDNILNQYAIPFWSFASKNIPATMRHVARYPSRYAAFARIYAMMNSDAVQGQDLNEGNTPAWLLHAQPVFIKIRGGRADGSDAWFGMPLSSVDPYTSVLDDAKGMTQEILRMFGVQSRPGTTGEILDDAPWSEDKNRFLQDVILSKLYPQVRAAMSDLSNRDLTSDYKKPLDSDGINTYLGYAMSPRTEMWLRTFLPILDTINRENPGNIFGTASYTNPKTGAVRRGSGSQMLGSGGVPRTDRQQYKNESEFPFLENNRWMWAAGLKIYPVDEATQTGATLIDLYSSLKEGKTWIRNRYRDVKKLDEGSPEYNRRMDEINRATQFFYQVAGDRLRLQEYARKQGITPDRALTELQSQGRKIGDLPTDLTPEEEHSLISAEMTRP